MNNANRVVLDTLASALSGQTMDNDSQYTFLVSKDLLLTLATEVSDSIGLYCTVFRADSTIANDMKEEILIANYGCAGTNGATLGIYTEDNSVMLTQLIPCANHIPENRLLEIGLAFIRTCIAWHERLNNIKTLRSNSSYNEKFDSFLKI